MNNCAAKPQLLVLLRQTRLMGRGLAGVVLLGALGCAYSPPIRGLHPGMPGRLVQGQLEVGGEAGGGGLTNGGLVTAPTTGGAHVAYGLSDTLVVEGGANLNLFEGAWATAYGGVRLSRSKPVAGGGLRLIGELELGAGLGLGGRVNASAAPWASYQSYGLYEGLGVGLRWNALGAYVRGRLDASVSNTAPATLWPTLMAGLDARAGEHVVFGVGAGMGGFWNRTQGLVGIWFYEAQVALLFDLRPAK